jgi:1-acyl-sn-glycerol-3-phosphate acyltransferase
MRRWLDTVALLLTRVLARVFYRSVEIRGAEHVPASGPVLFVANHGNSLVDPLLLIALLPRRIRFLAKSTLWQNPLLVPLLALAGAVPVYRRQDGDDMTKNRDTFARCYEELAAGGGVALFPEGISYHAPELQPLKTGAARIALGAEGVHIVPVGLTFEEKASFRSRVLLVIGEPLEPAPAEDPRDLTARIEDGLRHVTLNFESWEVSRLVERVAEVYAGGERVLPGRPDLAEQFSVRQAFGEGYAEAREKHPERVEAVEHRASHYAGMLEALGVRDDQLTSRYPWSHVGAYLGDRIGLLLLALPVAAVGTLLNYLPYRLPGFVGQRVREDRHLPATYKILTGMIALPVFWALEAWAAAALWGPRAGLLTAVGAPLCGWFALLFHERYGSLWREIRAYLTLRLRPAKASALRALRAEIHQEIGALVAERQSGADTTGD